MATDIRGQGTKFRISTAEGSPIVITGISKANPAVVTANNTLAAQDIIYTGEVVGMTEVNGRAFVVASPTGTSFQLKGIDSTGYNTYVSGGTAKKQTMTDVGNVKSFDGFDGEADEIDVTDFDSVAKEFGLGLQDFGSISMEIGLDSSNAGQSAMLAAKNAGSAKVFTITLRNGLVAAFVGFVKSFSVSAAPNNTVRGRASIRITGLPTFFV
ncbi:MAG TPA: phage tail tube protein [Methylococcus sp.]|nr:phage tail tube protein [Methylococcus sp.]